MAKKVDSEFLKDTRDEHRKQSAGAQGSKMNGSTVEPASGSTEQSGTKEPAASGITSGTEAAAGQKDPGEKTSEQHAQGSASQPAPEPVRDEFKEKFDEYFKGAPVSGTIVTEFVDDFKCNLLMIYARKNGLDMPKEAFALNQKGKELSAFLVDYAVQNKLFDWIKKYPLASAACVIGISAASSLVLIEAMKKNKDENEELKKELASLREQQKKQRHETAEVVPDLNMQQGGAGSITDFINSV